MKRTTKQQFTDWQRDFVCDCGCGVRLRLVYTAWKNDGTPGIECLDVGIMERGQKRPRTGVVLRNDGKLHDFLKALPARGKTNPSKKKK